MLEVGCNFTNDFDRSMNRMNTGYEPSGLYPQVQGASPNRSGGSEERRATEAQSDAKTAENGIGYSVH
jgi:hypothetical protein